jgi:O-antigen ligase
MKDAPAKEILMICWIISAILDCVIYLPVLHYKLQFFEILFCFFLLTQFRSIIRFLYRPFPLKKPLFAFIALALLNMVAHFEQNVLLENLGTLYSCSVPIVFSHALLQLPDPKRVLERGLLGICILLPILSLAGYLFYYFGWTDSMVKAYDAYPYLGTVIRVVGLTNSPNKVVAFAAVGIFFLAFIKKGLPARSKWGLIAMLLFSCVFTYSKEIVIIPIVFLLVWLLKNFRSRFIYYGILSVSMLLITLLTYFYLTTDENPPARQDIIYPNPIAESSTVTIYPTSYYFLFRSSWQMIEEHPFTGVGFGNYIRTVEEHQRRGLYPSQLYSYEAHDNYAGLLAQYGIGYLLVLVWFITGLKKTTAYLAEPEQRFITATLLFFLLFGFIYFSYHMRLMWLLLGIAQYYNLYHQMREGNEAG